MGRRAAMRYLVYGYIGIRTRDTSGLLIDKPAPGFRFCLYDSEQVHSESHCPVMPAIKEPVFDIKENGAGSLEFVLLTDGSAEVFYNETKNGTPVIRTTTLVDINGNQLPAMPERLYNYILPKQTEIVLYRIIKKPNNTSECTELWAGRVDTIKKDFYNNWSVYAEGELTYFNDVVLSETKITNATTSDRIMRDVIGKFNDRIRVIANPDAWGTSAAGLKPSITLTIQNPPEAIDPNDPQHPWLETSTYNPPQLPRLFHIGDLADLGLPGVASSSDLDNTFTISDGSTVMSVIQSLIDKYGGHIEITRNKQLTDTRIINWYKSGTYDDSRDAYNWNGYHSFVTGTSQVIEFGVNLLDFSEEQDTSDLFTVLIPHGQAVVTTTTDSEGNMTSTSGAALTISGNGINKLRPGKDYIYNDRLVNAYGWIEKVETWNVNDANLLYQLALAYYKDLHLGAKNITIKAYDLKNLIGNEQGLKNEAELLAIDALYLYDVVYVRSAAHNNKNRSLVGDNPNMSMPIKGIKIPLDKFTTDTEYTISNGVPKRSILSPGTAGQKQKQTIPQPEPDPSGDDPTPTPEEEPLPKINPIGITIGVDDDIAHYPVIYLDRGFKYATPADGGGISIHENDGEETATVTLIGKLTRYEVYNGRWISYDHRTGQPLDLDMSDYFMINYNKVPQYSTQYSVTKFGFSSNSVDTMLAGGESLTSKSQAPGSVFFTDKLSAPSKATMRLRNDHENKINWFEKIYDDGADPHVDSELQPFVSSNSGYYSVYSEANVTPGQAWGGFANEHIQAPEIEWEDPVEFGEGYAVSNIIDAINRLAFDGTTIGNILYDRIHMQLEANVLAENYLELAYYYETAAQGGNSYTIRQKLSVRWRPEVFESGYRYYFMVGKAVVGDAIQLYYTYYKEQELDSSSSDENDYWSLRKAQAMSEFIRVGFPGPTSTINAGDFSAGYGGIKYCEQVDVTYGQYTGKVWVARESPGTGIRTTYMYDALGGLLTADSPTAGHLEGCPYSKGFDVADAIYKHGQYGYTDVLERLLAALVQYDRVMANSGVTKKAYEAQNRLNKVKAKHEAYPFMVVCKVKSDSDADGYGSIAFQVASGSNFDVEYDEEHNCYVFANGSAINLGPDAGGTPIMICKDTLMYNQYLFYETQSYGNTILKVSNHTPIPLWDTNSSSLALTPITVLAKCGGSQTTYTPNNIFLRLSGDPKTSHCYGNDVIFPRLEDRDAPGNRSLEQRTTEGDHDKVWYYGTDMKRLGELNGFTDLSDASEEELSKYYINTKGRQPLTIGGKYYIRVTPTLFIRCEDATS